MVEKEFQKRTYVLLLEKPYVPCRWFLVLWPPRDLQAEVGRRSQPSSQTLRKCYALRALLVVKEQARWCLYPDQKCDGLSKPMIIFSFICISNRSLPNLPLSHQNTTKAPSHIIMAGLRKIRRGASWHYSLARPTHVLVLRCSAAGHSWVQPALGTKVRTAFGQEREGTRQNGSRRLFPLEKVELMLEKSLS